MARFPAGPGSAKGPLLAHWFDLEVSAQPDDSTCGPTCLHGVYRYYGLDRSARAGDPRRAEPGGRRHARRPAGNRRAAARLRRHALHLQPARVRSDVGCAGAAGARPQARAAPRGQGRPPAPSGHRRLPALPGAGRAHPLRGPDARAPAPLPEGEGADPDGAQRDLPLPRLARDRGRRPARVRRRPRRPAGALRGALRLRPGPTARCRWPIPSDPTPVREPTTTTCDLHRLLNAILLGDRDVRRRTCSSSGPR